MIAKEGWELARRLGAFVVNHIGAIQFVHMQASFAIDDQSAGAAGKSEIQDGWQFGIGRKFRQVLGLLVIDIDFAKHVEMIDPIGFSVVENGGRELLPELVTDMFGRIDAEAVDLVIGDPVFVDIDHAINHARVRRI